ALVVGGVNILRGGRANFCNKIRRATADSMWMIATMINALALRDMLMSEGVYSEVFSEKGVDGLLKFASAHEFNQELA
ncbi:UMP kinase, partial [Francisella tularensis subsp. holarctica]|nr:UMP kinase [Francisella tularensis subsp. holarctica]